MINVSPSSGAFDVGPASDFEHAVPRVFKLGDREVGVVRWGDRFFALRNHCPDQGGPLCAGTVRPPLSAGALGDHVELTVDDTHTPVIACPWHHYEFDLDTGHEIRGARRAITYRVEVEDGRVYVRMGAATAS